MRIIIVGTGGVGGYLGAKLWKAGHDLTFVARDKHLTVMRQNGLLIESPEGNISVRATFTDTLAHHPSVDLVIIAVKSFDTLATCKLIQPVLKTDTMVLSIQNGVENEGTLAQEIGSHHVIGGVAYIFSTIKQPGIVQHHGETAKFKFGELNGELTDRCSKLEGIFRQASIDAVVINTIQRVLWEKWIFICGMGGMTAFKQTSIGNILADTKSATMLTAVVAEAATIARKKAPEQFTDIEEKAIAHYRRLPPESTSSMYYDITHQKRIEVDALNGAVVRFGTALNIPTPANKEILESLQPFA